MSEPDFLKTDDGRSIAYRRIAAQDPNDGKPGVVFLGGFRSDMEGTKAECLSDWAKERGVAFLRFDYTGHGSSSGVFEEGCIGDWACDARDALEALTAGPQILVGSSMGGWIALLLAKHLPERVAGLVGIAAAPDFTEDSMWARASENQRGRLLRDGRIEEPSDYSDDPYVITRRLIEDGRRNLVLRAPLNAPFPVRLLQGTADTDVSVEVALRLLSHLDGNDVRLLLLRGSDHRMSEERELRVLKQTLDDLI